MCALTVPAVFDQSEEEGLVVVLRSEVPAGLEQAVRRALTLCPSGALAAV
jgi:ferredoxin